MSLLRYLLLVLTVAPVALSNTIQTCLQHAVDHGGSVAFPGDLLYQTIDVNRYNLNIPVTPAAVTFPISSDQVAAIVKCAADNGYPVQPKSGGHSYGNYCKPCPSRGVRLELISLSRSRWNERRDSRRSETFSAILHG